MIKKIKREPIDMGTSELSKRLRVVPKPIGGGMEYQGKVVDETYIDRLLLEDRINSSDHSTLEKFLHLLQKANFVGMRSPVYDAPLSADPSIVGDRRANQIRAVVSLFRRMDERLGKGKRIVLVNMVLIDRPWPDTDEQLRDAIDTLAKIMMR